MEWGLILGGAALLLPLLLLTDRIGKPWLAYWHGIGEAWQYQFYRCHGCRRLVTHHHIAIGGCPCHESVKISPARLRLREKARLVFLPWTVTSPLVRRDSVKRQAMLAERAQ